MKLEKSSGIIKLFQCMWLPEILYKLYNWCNFYLHLASRIILTFKTRQFRKNAEIYRKKNCLEDVNRNVRKRTFWYIRPTKTQNQPAHPRSLIRHFRCLHGGPLHTSLSKMRAVNIQVRLRGCAVWPESSPRACSKVLFLTLRELRYRKNCEYFLVFKVLTGKICIDSQYS